MTAATFLFDYEYRFQKSLREYLEVQEAADMFEYMPCMKGRWDDD